ncbi:TSUP family transporter [Micromonospora sp. AB353]|uniref:TSUP family transporter n=1 Tax=Micromonospora sp. AB353 TaxID=3413282 RepID=UPI003C2A0C3D
MQTPPAARRPAVRSSLLLAFTAGAAVGVLGGMIGLGGAEFRLPLLIMLFGFAALQAVILNKALSLVVVLTALPARLAAVPLSALAPHWTVVVNLLLGSMAGAWVGASWATRMRSSTLYRILAALLVLIAVALIGNHAGTLGHLTLAPTAVIAAGVIAGFFIGVVSAVMGVAGGELLIPTIVLRHARLATVLAFGSIAGTVLGGLLLGVVPDAILVPGLAALLALSSIKVWRHANAE